MAATILAIRLPRELVARIEACAAAAGLSRGAVVRLCLDQTLARLEEDLAVREARPIYHAIESDPEVNRLQQAFAAAASETLPI